MPGRDDGIAVIPPGKLPDLRAWFEASWRLFFNDIETTEPRYTDLGASSGTILPVAPLAVGSCPGQWGVRRTHPGITGGELGFHEGQEVVEVQNPVSVN